MEKKITKKEMFTLIANAIDNYLSECGENYGFTEGMVSFIDHEIELLSKKSGSKKPTANQVANEGLKDIIVANLSAEGMTASEVLASSEEFAGMSNQKISALLKQLVDDGRVIKKTDKKKSIFKIA